jgi:hypothetical protein
MSRPKTPDGARVPVGLKLSERDAARLGQALALPRFAGMTRAQWCRRAVTAELDRCLSDAPPASDQILADQPIPRSKPSESRGSVSDAESPAGPATRTQAPGAARPAIGRAEPARVSPAPMGASAVAHDHRPEAYDNDSGTYTPCGCDPYEL